jgi:F0F1-type ATP synthase membrane subunit b/b'
MTTVESRLSRLEGVYEHLATKADIAELRAEMQSAYGELRAEMQSANAELRAEMQSANAELRAEMQSANAELRAEMQSANAELRAEMQEMKVTLIKWVVGVQISVAGIMVAGGIAALAILV